MRVYDVTVPIRAGMPVYPGDPEVRVSLRASLAAGDQANLTRLDFGLHTGTHVDAPNHFIEGAAGVESVPLDALIGEAWVVDATHLTADIDRSALAALDIPDDAERILFRTPNSQLWEREAFSPDFIGLTADAAAALVERGVRLVGIDYLSIAPAADPAPTHRVLLEAGVVILEGLDLRDVPGGHYQLVCLSLLVEGADGAPARAILVAAQ